MATKHPCTGCGYVPEHDSSFHDVMGTGNYLGALFPKYRHMIELHPQLVEALRKLVSQCESMGRASHTNAVIEAANAAVAAADRAEREGA